MLFKTRSASVYGIEAHLVDVEVNLTTGSKAYFTIVGLPDPAVRESRNRVMAAIRNSGATTNFFHGCQQGNRFSILVQIPSSRSRIGGHR